MELVDVLAQARREARRRLPLYSITLATPCEAKWDDMIGDDRNRLCQACDKDVHDLTVMSADEIAAFLGDNPDACVRIYQRADAKVMRQDCPVGLRRARHRSVAFSGLSVAAAALGCFTALATLFATPAAAAERIEPRAGTLHVADVLKDEPGILHVIGSSSMIVSVDGVAMGTGVVGVALASFATHVVTGVDPSTGEQHTECVYVAPGHTKTVHIGNKPPPPRPGGLRMPTSVNP